MDRTGDFSCFSFLFVYILPSSSHLSPPLTFSSAEPTLNDFMFFLLFFFLKNKKIKMKKVRQSSLTTPGALKAPFTAVLRRFQSLLLNLFLHRFLFFFSFFLNNEYCQYYYREKNIKSSVAPLIGLLPYWPLVDQDAGWLGVWRDPVESSGSAQGCPPSLSSIPPLYLCSHWPFLPLPNAHISAPLTAMTDSLPAFGPLRGAWRLSPWKPPRRRCGDLQSVADCCFWARNTLFEGVCKRWCLTCI